ncbi:unnamed protein product, partial [Rangifer tarandus platyrhynchus]
MARGGAAFLITWQCAEASHNPSAMRTRENHPTFHWRCWEETELPQGTLVTERQ